MARKCLADGTIPEVGMVVTKAEHVNDQSTWSYYLGQGVVKDVGRHNCLVECVKLSGEDGIHYEYVKNRMDEFLIIFDDLVCCAFDDIQFDESEFIGLIFD